MTPKYKLRDRLMNIFGREFVVGSLTTSTANSEALYSLVAVTGLTTTLCLTESEVDKLFTRMAVQQTPAAPTYPFTSPGKFNQGELVCFRTVPTEIYEVMSKGLVDNGGKLGYWIAKPHTPAVVVWAEENELVEILANAGVLDTWATLADEINETIKAPADLHKNHEIVLNQVLGKSFKYCRHCKVEV